MSKGQLGVLHTNSVYAASAPPLPHISEDVKFNRLKIQIQNLKTKENAFAQRFGYSTIEDFIRGVREILKMNPNDMRALQRFTSNNLQKYLNQFRLTNANMFINQPITLRLQGSSARIGELLNIHGGSNGVTWSISSPNIVILAEWDTKIIKDITNKLASTHFNKQSENIDYLINFLTSSANENIKIEVGNKKESINEFIINNSFSPFELKPSELKRMAQTDPQLVSNLKTRIDDFINNTLCAGASSEFLQAVQTVAGQKFTSLESLSFFMGGKGWSTHALGAFGELSTAIMFQYIANKTPNKIMATQISAILGDQLNSYGQQLHTDLEIFKAFGIQVKNYGSATDFKTGAEKTVNVHLHPSEIASLGASEGVVDYIVNSYFNTSISKYPEESLNTFFEAHASELLNLDFNANIPDQVSFYMIGANFIPGSVILEQAFMQLTIKVHSSISGKEGGDDESYAKGDNHNWHENFTKWWESTVYPPAEGMFRPTGNNTIAAWDRNVSITTTFTYSAIFDGAYKLF